MFLFDSSQKITPHMIYSTMASLWIDGLLERLSLFKTQVKTIALVTDEMHQRYTVPLIMRHLQSFYNTQNSRNDPLRFVIFQAKQNQDRMVYLTGPHEANDTDKNDTDKQAIDLCLILPILQQIFDIPGFLIQVKNQLQDQSFCLGAFFGEDTLIELRDLCLSSDFLHFNGLVQRFIPTIHSKDAASLLSRSGFSDCVSDRDRHFIYFRHPYDLIQSLRAHHMRFTTKVQKIFDFDNGKDFSNRWHYTHRLYWDHVLKNYPQTKDDPHFPNLTVYKSTLDIVYVIGFKDDQVKAQSLAHQTKVKLFAKTSLDISP